VRGYGLLVLALQGSRISAITWFSDRSLFPTSGFRVPSARNLTLWVLRDYQCGPVAQGWWVAGARVCSQRHSQVAQCAKLPCARGFECAAS
jgi:hypothetical protein